MDFHLYYDIASTAAFIQSRNYNKVALQFPEKLRKDAPKVANILRREICRLRDSSDSDSTRQNGGRKDVRLFVLGDTVYNGCCVDEYEASHVGADCVVHYGHTCLSPTSVLPAYFVFEKADISILDCVQHMADCAASTSKPILVLYGLEYAYAVQDVRQTLVNSSTVSGSRSALQFVFADVKCSVIDPSKGDENSNSQSDGLDTFTSSKCSIGGLIWNLPEGCKMEDYVLFWIGSDNLAFSQVVLTFNGCEIVRYDVAENLMVPDFLQQRRILKRRYYLVEKAKDANIIGILVGTLSVAGYQNLILQMQDLIAKAGKWYKIIVMGRPNPAKLANFPECDVVIYVSCAQTSLLDSKEFLAPLITPFEAMLAFTRGSQWTGAYVMDFRDLISSSIVDTKEQSGEARYSFLQGGYVEDFEHLEDAEREDTERQAVALSHTAMETLQLSDKQQNSLLKRVIKSGAEFLANRSYQGLEIRNDGSSPELYIIGRSGKASRYADEKSCERS